MTRLASMFLYFALLATAACAEDIPDDPTWNEDVELLLTANCGRCHGETTAPGFSAFGSITAPRLGPRNRPNPAALGAQGGPSQTLVPRVSLHAIEASKCGNRPSESSTPSPW